MMRSFSHMPLQALPALSVPGVLSLSQHRARLPQQIRRVPMFRPVLVRVVAGVKRVYSGAEEGEAQDVGTGCFAAFAARSECSLLNIPAENGYLAEVLGIAPDSIEAFRGRHGSLVAEALRQPVSPTLSVTADTNMEAAWQHLRELWQAGVTPQPEIARHRLEEVLLCLALRGAGQALFLTRHDCWSERLRLVLQSAPGRKWSASDAAAELHCSEATLRRHLAAEGSSLRNMLETIRMNAGLGLVLNSARRIDDIALACGYDSASRFSIRFRQRFGQSPTEMRATT
ncbi:MAG: helix-turn-helix transcriptional regulator [Rhodocyclaceae bacterium]